MEAHSSLTTLQISDLITLVHFLRNEISFKENYLAEICLNLRLHYVTFQIQF